MSTKKIHKKNNNKTRKNERKGHYKNYIVVDKYKLENFGVKTYMYVIHFNKQYTCKKSISLTRRIDYLKKYLVDSFHVLDQFKKNKLYSKRIYKNENLMKNLVKIMNPREKYTYCLNKDTLVIIETFTKDEYSIMKDLMSKHVIYCETDACASGEMVIHNNDTFVFDNNSGTFKPSIKNILSLKDALGNGFKIKVVSKKSKNHDKYFNYVEEHVI